MTISLTGRNAGGPRSYSTGTRRPLRSPSVRERAEDLNDVGDLNVPRPEYDPGPLPPLHVFCWKWRHPTYRVKYTTEHVNALYEGFSRFHSEPFRFVCVTDDPVGIECETAPLWPDCSRMGNPNGAHLPSCYRRLKLLSSETTRALGVNDGDRVLSIDLDVVPVDNLVPLFARHEEFVGWKRIGANHPIAYNGTLFMFRAGTRDFVWDDFDPSSSPARASKAGYFGSDQGWLSYRLQGREVGWTHRDGVLSFSSEVCRRPTLPAGARLVSFNGKRKPWDRAVVREAPWIKDYWRH